MALAIMLMIPFIILVTCLLMTGEIKFSSVLGMHIVMRSTRKSQYAISHIIPTCFPYCSCTCCKTYEHVFKIFTEFLLDITIDESSRKRPPIVGDRDHFCIDDLTFSIISS